MHLPKVPKALNENINPPTSKSAGGAAEYHIVNT